MLVLKLPNLNRHRNKTGLQYVKIDWACKCSARHSAATSLATGKIGSKQRYRPVQKHAGRQSIDRKSAPHLSNPRYLLKCDELSCERVVKTFQTSLRRNKGLRPVRDFLPACFCMGSYFCFEPIFLRCHALLCFVTSSLASPIMLTWFSC